MQVYAGLDVSLKTMHICLMDEAGKIVWRGVSASDPASIREALSPFLATATLYFSHRRTGNRP